jgi:phosphate-selective porin
VFEVDPTRNQIPLGVCYMQWQSFEQARVRLGHFRTPFALENGMTGANQLPWLERSMAIGSGNALAPGFSPGVMLFGSFAGTFTYYVGAQNRVDSNNQVTSDPLLSARIQLDFASGFAIGASGLWVRQGGSPQESMTGVTPAQYRFFAPVTVQGHDLRGSVDVSFFHGPLFIIAEYGHGQQERRRAAAGGRDGAPFAVRGAYLGAGFVFWGPSAGRPHVRPFQNWTLFPDLDRPRLGRFAGAELIARVEWIDLDDRDGGRGTSAPSRAADALDIKGCDARALTVGLNIFPIENVRVSVSWSHVRVGDSGRAPDDGSRHQDEVVLRGQLDF